MPKNTRVSIVMMPWRNSEAHASFIMSRMSITTIDFMAYWLPKAARCGLRLRGVSDIASPFWSLDEGFKKERIVFHESHQAPVSHRPDCRGTVRRRLGTNLRPVPGSWSGAAIIRFGGDNESDAGRWGPSLRTGPTETTGSRTTETHRRSRDGAPQPGTFEFRGAFYDPTCRR